MGFQRNLVLWVYLHRLGRLCLAAMKQPAIQVLPNLPALAEAVAQIIVAAAQSAADDGRRFSIALSGGSTPKCLYELLSNDPWYDRFDWSRWDVYFGDERCVPPTHADSNYRMARQTLLDHVPITAEHVFRIKTELDPQQAADNYDQLLRQHFADTSPDVVLLGMGEDGHTASLFPHTQALKETARCAVANFVPQLDQWRITVSAEFINRARLVLILVSGQNKAQRVAQVLEGAENPDELPIQLIQPLDGQLLWLMDADAAGMND